MTAPLLSPMDPSILASWAFLFSVFLMVANAFLYGWFLDYKTITDSKLVYMANKIDSHGEKIHCLREKMTQPPNYLDTIDEYDPFLNEEEQPPSDNGEE